MKNLIKTNCPKKRRLSHYALSVTFAAIIFIFLLTGALISSASVNSKDSINVTIILNGAKSTDTLTMLSSQKYYKNTNDPSVSRISKVFSKDGSYHFSIPVHSDYGYWQLFINSQNGNSKKGITNYFFWEAGDSIKLTLSYRPTSAGIYSEYSFTGKGSEKYQYKINTEKFMKEVGKAYRYNKGSDSLFNVANIDFQKKVYEYIDSHSVNISDLSKKIMKVDFITEYSEGIFYSVRNYLLKPNQKLEMEYVLKRVRDIFSGRGLLDIDSGTLAKSYNAAKFFYWGLKTECLIVNKEVKAKWIFDQILTRFQGDLRDELIVYAFQNERNDKGSVQLYEKMLSLVKSDYSLVEMQQLRRIYQNKKLKDYTFTDLNDKNVRLSNFKGKVKLLDVWFNGCGACSAYYQKTLSKVEQSFKTDSNVVFISINVDNDRNKWLTGIKSGQYTNESQQNLYTGGLAMSHPFLSDNNIAIAPVVLLIDAYDNIRLYNTEELFAVGTLTQAIKNAK